MPPVFSPPPPTLLGCHLPGPCPHLLLVGPAKGFTIRCGSSWGRGWGWVLRTHLGREHHCIGLRRASSLCVAPSLRWGHSSSYLLGPCKEEICPHPSPGKGSAGGGTTTPRFLPVGPRKPGVGPADPRLPVYFSE